MTILERDARSRALLARTPAMSQSSATPSARASHTATSRSTNPRLPARSRRARRAEASWAAGVGMRIRHHLETHSCSRMLGRSTTGSAISSRLLGIPNTRSPCPQRWCVSFTASQLLVNLTRGSFQAVSAPWTCRLVVSWFSTNLRRGSKSPRSSRRRAHTWRPLSQPVGYSMRRLTRSGGSTGATLR